MLQIHIVRDQRENVIRGLKKRRLKDAEVLVDKALALDQKRKDTQRRNDEVLAESNTLAKDIGNLMKSGQKEKAEEIKIKTTALKKTASDLTAQLSSIEEELQQVLFLSPTCRRRPCRTAGVQMTISTFMNMGRYRNLNRAHCRIGNS